VICAAALAARSVEVDTSTDSVLDRSSVDWRFYQASLERFGGDEVVVIAVQSPEPFAAESLRLIGEWTRSIDEIDGVRRVDSLASVPFIRVSKDNGLNLDPLLAQVAGGCESDGSECARLIELDRVAPRTLVSRDGRILAISVLLDRALGHEVERVVDAIQRAIAGDTPWVSGVPVFRREVNRRTASEIAFYVTATIGIVAGFLYAVFRSLVAVLVPLGTGGAGTILLLGAMGLTGTELSLTTMILPSLMLAIGCANVTHALEASAGARGTLELQHALDPVLLPITLTGLTTTIGFLAVSSVQIEAIQAIGTFGALGVFVVLAATLTAVPAALTLWPLPANDRRLSEWMRSSLCGWLVRLSQVRGREVRMAGVMIGAVALVGLSQLTIETDATRWFPRGNPVRESYEEIREGLSGISPMNVVVESANGEAVTLPAVVDALGKLTAYLESLPEVGRAISVADPLRQMNGGFLEDESMPLPRSRELIEQYLLLLGGVDQIRDLVTDDRLAANVLLRVNDNGSEALRTVAKSAEEWWEENGPSGYTARTTGIMFEFARAEDEIAIGQLRGLAFALASVGVVLLAVFRDFRLAGLTLAANGFPILLAFGGMGLLGIPLDAGTVVVGNLAVGIAIDETMHLVGGLQDAKQGSRDHEVVLLEALGNCVPPIVYTTLAIVLGFGVLGFSEFTFTRNLGVLTVVVMLLCVLADFLLLPSLLSRKARH
jgi:predicted RND superfamily exporter protein